MNPHKIANSGSSGSGKQARDLLAAKADRRNIIPDPLIMNEMVVQTGVEAMVASFGRDSDNGLDYTINSLGYDGAAIGGSSTAAVDAKIFCALWNAYREGELVWKDDAAIAAEIGAGKRIGGDV